MYNIVRILQQSLLDQPPAWGVELIGVLASSILSALLVLIYWRMYRVQKSQNEIQQSQTDIMDIQSKIMAASFTPDVIVKDTLTEGDTVKINISNQGRGRAKNFRVSCQPYVTDSKGNYRPAWEVDGPCFRPVVVPLSRCDDPGSGDAELYKGTVKLGYPDSGTTSFYFSEAINQLGQIERDRKFGAELYLIYDSEIGDRFVQRIKCINDFEIDTGVTLEKAIQNCTNKNSIIDSLD
ncbi:hypothetical protein [Halovenus sp. HT40]|uniref:hypothetical protein n=1 Tax=Halovenus sp. HT40 TaxID=3126691 RepID=UPI00300EE760